MIIWTATIGHTDLKRIDDYPPPGSDQPMRRAVEEAFERITGVSPNITFSGFGQKYLDESHLAVIEERNVLDDPAHEAAWNMAKDIVEDIVLEGLYEYEMLDRRATHAIEALTELIWFLNKQRVIS
jgi:hypothetical protein